LRTTELKNSLSEEFGSRLIELVETVFHILLAGHRQDRVRPRGNAESQESPTIIIRDISFLSIMNLLHRFGVRVLESTEKFSAHLAHEPNAFTLTSLLG